jgi:predicted Zn-dependent protease
MSNRADTYVVLVLCGCGALAPTTPAEKPSEISARLAQNPDDVKANIEAGAASEASGDWLRAEQYYLRAEALGMPEMQVLPRILRVLVAGQRYHEALRRCEQRLVRVPEDRNTRYVRAALLMAVERGKDAERELITLQHTKPTDPRAWLELGRLYRDQHDRVQARAMFAKYLELAPDGADAPVVRFDLAEDPRLAEENP